MEEKKQKISSKGGFKMQRNRNYIKSTFTLHRLGIIYDFVVKHNVKPKFITSNEQPITILVNNLHIISKNTVFKFPKLKTFADGITKKRNLLGGNNTIK